MTVPGIFKKYSDIYFFLKKKEERERKTHANRNVHIPRNHPRRTWQPLSSSAKLSLRKQTGIMTSWVTGSADRRYQEKREAPGRSG